MKSNKCAYKKLYWTHKDSHPPEVYLGNREKRSQRSKNLRHHPLIRLVSTNLMKVPGLNAQKVPRLLCITRENLLMAKFLTQVFKEINLSSSKSALVKLSNAGMRELLSCKRARKQYSPAHQALHMEIVDSQAQFLPSLR
jgi:hypothetical protein